MGLEVILTCRETISMGLDTITTSCKVMWIGLETITCLEITCMGLDVIVTRWNAIWMKYMAVIYRQHFQGSCRWG